MYLNTPVSALYLDRRSTRYIGGILEMLSPSVQVLARPAGGLRTGKPQNEVKHGQEAIFEELYEELPKLEQFMGAMTGLSRITSRAFAAKFDFSKVQDALRCGRRDGSAFN